MIHASKLSLRTDVEVHVLHIRDRELGYFYTACTQISTQAALLAGFCYSGLQYVGYVDGDLCEKTCAEFTYPLTVIGAMGFAMLALWQATLASMFAPGLALRGPPGSMDMAVNQLIEEYQGATELFSISLFLFLSTALLWSWTWDTWYTSVAGSAIVLATMFIISRKVVRVRSDFEFDAGYHAEFEMLPETTGGWASAPSPTVEDAQSKTPRADEGRVSSLRSALRRQFSNPMLMPTPMRLF